jgi:hypothetical protein
MYVDQKPQEKEGSHKKSVTEITLNFEYLIIYYYRYFNTLYFFVKLTPLYNLQTVKIYNSLFDLALNQ